MRIYPYLNNSNFLSSLAYESIKEHYVKITVLDWNEKDIAEVQSIINSGNVNINGDSSLRRTGTLTTYLDSSIYDVNNINNLFSLNKKIRVEKGLNNPSSTLYKDYPILWFPLGIYIITGLSINHQANGLIQLNLTIQDKMCLLNGTINGAFPATINLDTMQTIDSDGQIVTKKTPINQIIRELINHWGGEQLGNILISGVPDKIMQARTWKQDAPLIINTDNQIEPRGIDELTPEELEAYHIYNKGDIIGHEWVPFVYTGSDKGLIVNAGSTITAALDSIVSFMGNNVEYFYNVYGQFIFREKPNNLNQTRTSDIIRAMNGDVAEAATAAASEIKFIFNDTTLLSVISQVPNILNIKNDFIVIGERKVGDKIFPIYYETCIDKIPEIPLNNTINGICFYYDVNDKTTKGVAPKLLNIIDASLLIEGQYYYTDTEIYIDTTEQTLHQGLYVYDGSLGQLKEVFDINGNSVIMSEINTNDITDWQTYQYYQDLIQYRDGLATSYYSARLFSNWPLIYDFAKNEIKNYNNFYLEILNENTEIGKYSVNNIGRRTYVYENKKINCLFEPNNQEPEYIYINLDAYKGTDGNIALDNDKVEIRQQSNSYIIIEVDQKWLQDNTEQTASWLSAYSVIRNLIYQYTDYNETLQLTTIPLYFLDANCNIKLNLSEQKITGNYWVKNISVPLDSSGMMNMNVTKLSRKF